MSAAIGVESGVLRVGAANALFGTLPTTSGMPCYVSADGQKFLTVIREDPSSSGQLTVVRNWTSALKK